MTSFVYDFKDIASRMKGELKPEDRLECYRCEGLGWIEDPFAPPIECNLCCNPFGRPRP